MPLNVGGLVLDDVREPHLAALGLRFPAYRWSALRAFAAELVDNGLAETERNMLRLTPQGRLVADEVGARIMEV